MVQRTTLHAIPMVACCETRIVGLLIFHSVHLERRPGSGWHGGCRMLASGIASIRLFRRICTYDGIHSEFQAGQASMTCLVETDMKVEGLQ